MSATTNKKMEQLRALQKDPDKSLTHLINEAYRILGNPIILYDIDWKILAYPEGVVTDDLLWNSHIKYEAMSSEVRNLFANEDLVSAMVSLEKVVFLNSETLKYNRIFGKIFDQDDLPVACVSIVATDKPFEDDDLMAVEVLCKALAKVICVMPYYQGFAQKKLEMYINMLIDGNIKDKVYVSGYIDLIYKGLGNNLYIAVADIAQCDPEHTKLEYYRDLFKQTRPSFKYSIYANYIIIIMSTNENTFYPQRCLNRLNKLFEQENIKVGISSCFENLFILQGYYHEAVKALETGSKSDNREWCFVYDNEDDS